MIASKMKAKCSCCNQEVIVEYKPGKWQGEKDKVIITHAKMGIAYKLHYTQ